MGKAVGGAKLEAEGKNDKGRVCAEFGYEPPGYQFISAVVWGIASGPSNVMVGILTAHWLVIDTALKDSRACWDAIQRGRKWNQRTSEIK